MKRGFLFLFFSFFLTISYSQSGALKPNALVQNAKNAYKQESVDIFKLSADRHAVTIPKEIEDYSLLSLDAKAIKSLSGSRSRFISLRIPQNQRNDITLELVEVNPFSEDFILRTAPSMERISINHGKHYRGIIRGQERSIAAISIFDDQVVGMISHPAATGNLVIGKLENSSQHILYQDDQISSKKQGSCQTADDMKAYSKQELSHSNAGTRALSDCVRLYLEVDYDIYTNKGSTVANVNSYIGGLFNQVTTLYANEQINTVVSEILVWTQPSPYNFTTSDAMLTAFGNQRNGFNGDLGMLLSYKASGGIAWLNGLCRSNKDYSMGYSGIHTSYQTVPTYSWSVEVCTHEFGHLFGSQHTHACVWNGNNTAIDGCYTPEGGCANPGLPPATTGGTIMSYCHLTSVGIKFSNGFGTQPGNVIRNGVTNATCLQACNGGGGGGGTQCNNVSLTLDIATDTYANETTWEIKNSAGVIVNSGGPYASGNTLYSVNLCLPAGCYTFTIKDQYGDGICCAHGNGSYTLKQGTNVLITGGQFAASETKSFCTSGTPASSLTLSTSTGAVGSAAGSANVGVTSNVTWSASSNATTWCTVSPSSGSNNGSLLVNYLANSSTTSRSATITVTGGGITRTYVLTQSGSTPSQVLTLSASSGTGTSAAGSNSVAVTSNVSWAATSNAISWCTVTPGNGSNNGTLTINFTANTASTARYATITVTGGGITRTYVLTQSGSTPTPTLTLNKSTESVTSTAGIATLGVTSNISWIVSFNATSWCTVTPTSGSNNGTIAINYTANTTTSSRSATITVTGGGITRTYVLTQSGSTPSASLDLSAASGNAGSVAGSSSVGLTSNVSWTATSNASAWCTVSPASGSNNGTLSVNYTANTATTSRSATITVTGGGLTKTYVLTQSGVTAPTCNDGIQNGNETGIDCGGSCPACASCTQVVLEIRTDQYPNEITWNIKNQNGAIIASGGNYSFSHTLNSHPQCLPAGCYTLNLTDGYGDGILSPGYYRILQGSTEIVSNEAYGTSKTVNFCVGNATTSNLTLSTNAGSAGSAAGSASVGVTSNVSWTATSNATAWCTVSPASGSNNGTLVVNYIANTTTTSRSATITVTGGGITRTYVLTQNGSTPSASLELSAASGNAGSAAGSSSVGVTSNVSWTATSNATAWCTVSPASGSNNGTLSVNYTANTATTSRSATITVTGGGLTKTYVLTQSGVTAPTCNDGIQNGNETGIDCGGSCPACASCTQVVLEIRTDQYPSEITWNIKNQNGAIIASGGNYSFSHTLNSHPQCLPAGCYTLNLLDGYGDGILSPGYYRILQGSTEIVSNQPYGISKTVNFCVGNATTSNLTLSTNAGSAGSAAGSASVGVTSNVSWTATSNATAWCTVTPASGSNNGTLVVNYIANTATTSRSATITVTGGGITRTYVLTQSGVAASTCNDGIQNGSETGVDCGGSCPACPTCTDGIKNGTETGVDCGGSCPPCSSGGAVVLAGNYFETGWEGWLDGGSDCFRYQGSFSPEGQYSIRIRDNSASESAMTSPVFNLTPYTSVNIEFKFRAVGMEAGEDFWLRYFNGTGWATVGTFISGSSFQNNQLYTINITLNGQFPSNAQFRFQCDASENDDEVYIDAVIIKGYTGSNLIEELISIRSENSIVLEDGRTHELGISPNPAHEMVSLKTPDQPTNIKVFNLAGQLMQVPVDIYRNQIDISALKSGVYIIQVETEDDVYSQKLVKM